MSVLVRARSRRRPPGQSLVEFALIVPIFLILVFGVIDAGRFVYMNSVLSQAAREGARLAAVEAYWVGHTDTACNQPGGPVCPADIAALKSDALAAANRMVSPFGSISASRIYLSCDAVGSAPTGTWTGVSCASSFPNSDAVSVRVELTWTPLTPIVGQYLGSRTISGSATMVIN
ncbi:MAG TPA: TadE family protein [Candidatus Limnocylindrales bacterium]